jgi:RNA-directed DNA polymerase
VDEESITDFEKRLKKNLYKIWNRMTSGSYFPPPVRMVKISKAIGGERKLGIPTVSDSTNGSQKENGARSGSTVPS